MAETVQLAEYVDRLCPQKLRSLREAFGSGELNWHRCIRSLNEKQKANIAHIVFGRNVNRMWIVNERNVATGHYIPIIFAEIYKLYKEPSHE